MSSEGGTAGGAARELSEAIGNVFQVSKKSTRGSRTIEVEVPRLSWEAFLDYFRLNWFQGEHVTGIGTTGSGKTTLALEILPIRTYVVGFGTKPRDETFTKLVTSGYERIGEWPPSPHRNRAVIWPKFKKDMPPREIKAKLRGIFGEALGRIYHEEGWAVFLDELRFITDYLGLKEEYELLLQQGRSIGITVVGLTQRPRYIPLVAYDQATHLFFWRENDYANLQRIAEIGFQDREEIAAIVSSLPFSPGKGGDFLYINTRTGEKYVSKVKPKG